MEGQHNTDGNTTEQAEKEKQTQFNEKRLWFLISTFFILALYIKGALPWVFAHNRPDFRYFMEIVSDNIFATFIFVLLPRLFKQIFGAYPIEYIRSASNANRSLIINNEGGKLEIKHEKPVSNTIDERSLGELTLQEDFIEESRQIAEKIYSRAGAYLMLGCSIAFVGLAVFSSSWLVKEKSESPGVAAVKDAIELSKFDSAKDSTSIALVKVIRASAIKSLLANNNIVVSETAIFEQKLINYLPRFGALFFIEFIAFFFLRQYRIMLEEYRYYESIKRRRQDNLVLYNAIEANKDNPDLIKAFSAVFTESTSHKLGKEETTQILEVHKLSAQELDFFGKLTELFKSAKSK